MKVERVCGHEIVVQPNVFNPVLFRSGKFFAEFLDSVYLVRKFTTPGSVLDVGTGSGVLAIVCASRGHTVVAVDINPDAVDCAESNAGRAGFQKSIDAKQSDLFESVAGQKFDLIVWNPPFFEGEPRRGFDQSWRSAGAIERFLAGAAKYLKRNGRVLLLWSSQRPEHYLERLADENDLAVTRLREAHFGVEKLLIYELRPNANADSVRSDA